MKKLALITAVIIAVSACFVGCAANDPLSNKDAYTATQATQEATEATHDEPKSVNPSDYENNVDGLCKYLKALDYLQGEPVKMAADLIGAEKGYRYVFTYEKGNINAELYEYNTNNLNDKAKATIESVKKNGYFQIQGFDKVEAYMSDNGKYLIIYSDSNLIDNNSPNENNKQRELDFLKAAEEFYK